jgi:hypothetical protein
VKAPRCEVCDQPAGRFIGVEQHLICVRCHEAEDFITVEDQIRWARRRRGLPRQQHKVALVREVIRRLDEAIDDKNG